jgi:amino acid adenylation domain-containing protein
MYPFDRLVEDLDLKRDTSRSALFDVMVTLQNIGENENDVEIKGEEIGKIIDYGEGVSKFDIDFMFQELGDHISIVVEYNTDVYERDMVERFIGHYENMLGKLLLSPEEPINQIVYISKEDESQLLQTFNDTKVDYPRDKTIVELFEEQVEKTPDNIAVVFEEIELSYKELNERSNQLADYLRNNYGIQPDNLVGIKLERSEEMIISILGILKSGGAYVPIDLEYPEDRITYMLEDCECKVLIDEDELNKFNKQQTTYIKENLPKATTPTDLAYVIYTSGSTGLPKGVMVEHKDLCNRIITEYKLLTLNRRLRACLTTNYVFDVSLLEIFLPLSNGGLLVVPTKEVLSSPTDLCSFLSKSGVNVLQGTPSFINNLLVGLKDKEQNNSLLERLCIGGESLSNSIVNEIKEKLPTVKINNHYGPTEAIIDAIVLEDVEYFERNIIGQPISNTQVYIIDKNQNIQPIGVSGEICIGGDGLARGYLNQPELTAEKFIFNPFVEGERMYRTGDLGRWLPNGNIEFIGRKDDQVKIRGYRIELGEIESVLRNQDVIEDAVLLVKEDEKGEKSIVAYVVGREELSSNEIRAELSKQVPYYMLPSYFVQIEEIPLTSNGKIDRKALPNPEGLGMSTGVEYVAPRSELEEKLVAIWEEVLGIEKIGITDNFFELGGHSLKIMRIISAIHKKNDIQLRMDSFFKYNTIKELVTYIYTLNKASKQIIPLSKSNYSITFGQQRLWEQSKTKVGNLSFHMYLVINYNKKVDKKILAKTFNILIQRHEALRANFIYKESKLKQIISEDILFKIEYLNLINSSDKDLILNETLKLDRNTPFDLSTDVLFRVKVIQLNKIESLCIITMHHIIGDGLSLEIFEKEITSLYSALIKGEDIPLKPLSISYRKCIDITNEQIETIHQDYWFRKFKPALPELNLKIDYSRPLEHTFNGNSMNFSINGFYLIELKKVAKENSCTAFIIILTLINVYLCKLTNKKDITIGTSIEDRDHKNMREQIGFFVNMLALRNKIDTEDNFISLLKKIKESTLEAFEHKSYPFLKLIQDLDLKTDKSRHPLFDIVLLVEEITTNDDSKSYGETKIYSKYDLTFKFEIFQNEILFKLEYNTDLFKEETILIMGNEIVDTIKKTITNPEINIKT